MTTKERLHLLVDALSEDEASNLLHFVEEHTGGSYLCPHCGEPGHVPNEETERALRDAEAGIGISRHTDASSFFARLGL
ncbi:MAG TPA: hypothetical protein VF006_21720 [Longimicrobium sp.]